MHFKVVKFSIQGQDHFAIKDTEIEKYKDLKDNYWWARGSQHFPCCLTTDKKYLDKIFEMFLAEEQDA